MLKRPKEAFRYTYDSFESVTTFGCSTASCEFNFSTLIAVNKSQRMSMAHERMAVWPYVWLKRIIKDLLNLICLFSKCQNNIILELINYISKFRKK